MSVTLTNCTQIKEWNEIIIRHNTFTKLPLFYMKKTNLKLHWKLCEKKVGVFIEGKVGRKKLKLYWKCKVTFILKQLFLDKATLILRIFFLWSSNKRYKHVTFRYYDKKIAFNKEKSCFHVRELLLKTNRYLL